MAKRGRPFQPGNKIGRGRPAGSRNKKTVLIDELVVEKSQSLLSTALKLAQQGNVPLLRLFLDRILPRPKDEPIEIGHLPMGTPGEVIKSQASVMQEVASGQLTLNQAEQLFSMMENCRLMLETHNLEQRVRGLEQLFNKEEADRAA
jgi:hypothetical protein